MDKETLLKLLDDEEIISKIKEIINQPKTTKKPRVSKKVAKKVQPKVKTTKRVSQKKTQPVKPRQTKKAKQVKEVIDKKSKEYGRSTFIDTLKDAVYEDIAGKKVNLVKLSKQLKPKNKEPRPRKKETITKKCVCGQKFESIGGYLCDDCIKGRNAK